MSNRKYYVIDCLSQPASGKILYSGGNTNLSFNIAENSNEFYVGGSARVTFKFRIIDNNATLEAVSKCSISPQCGLVGLFSSCDVHNSPTNTLISSVRNMPRLASSLYSVGMADLYDVQTSQQIQGLSNGTDYNSNNVGVYNLTANPTELQSYSVRPINGCLEQDWYLGSPLMNGNSMKVTLQLASDGNALTRIATPTTNYTYELSEVKLVYQTLEGSPEEIKAGRLKSTFIVKYTDMVKQSENRSPSSSEVESAWSSVVNQSGGEQSFSFKDYNNYITTIQSDNATTNLQLGISRVSSIFANFVESAKLNNLTTNKADSNKTYQILDSNEDPVPYSAVNFTKGGKLFPYEYTLTSNVESNNYVLNDDYTADRLAQLKKSYLDSVVPYNDNKYQQGSVVNSMFEQQYRPNVSADDCNGKGNGIGSGQLSVLGDGSSDFRVENLGIQINSKNTATFDNTSAFIYALHEKTIRWNNGMVSVES